MPKIGSSLDPTIVDGASLFDASEVLAERVGRSKITIDYTKLRECLDGWRVERGWRSGSPNTILMSIDPNSEGQQRFQTMLRRSGFEPDIIHFRDTFVSVPPGRNPSDMVGKSIVSLAPRIAYIAGLMARHPNSQFLVVSHSFELYGPLSDLRQRIPNGRVGIAYFGSLVDHRWVAVGLLDGTSGLDFFDLDRHGEDLIGVDLASRRDAADVRAGLSRF